MDYPAVIQGDEYSVWRVDDGGEVMPEMFSILFAAETLNGPLLGLNWWGSEGVNTFFLKKKEICLRKWTSNMDVILLQYR